jgi:hypothetical protein
MTTTQARAPVAFDKQTLDAVRPHVRDFLTQIPSYAQLPPEEQKKIAGAMVQVATYIANPNGVLTEKARPAELASALDTKEDAGRRATEDRGLVGKDFTAGAVKQGVEQFGALVKKVDFPKFVGGLIQNVFQAIVDSSIQQMRAYGDLLANVVKTVNEFADDHISHNNARDWLAGKFPGDLGVEIGEMSGGFAAGDASAPAVTANLVSKGDDPEAGLKKVSDSLGLEKPVTDLSNPEEEARLVQAARLQLARSRQQLLATMVMLGINRIVVTDGQINAKVLFDMRASDTARRGARASFYDQQHDTSKSSAGTAAAGWFSPVAFAAEASTESTTDHVATVESAVDETSEAKAEVKAKLSGEVRVNFKSDYFPLDKLASAQTMGTLQDRAKPNEKAVSGA